MVRTCSLTRTFPIAATGSCNNCYTSKDRANTRYTSSVPSLARVSFVGDTAGTEIAGCWGIRRARAAGRVPREAGQADEGGSDGAALLIATSAALRKRT